MKRKLEAQQSVRALRAQGLSYREILERVPVSKSSVSLWCRTVPLESSHRDELERRRTAAGELGLLKIAELRRNGKLKARRQCRSPLRDDAREVEAIRALYERERLSVRQVAVRLGVGWWRVYRMMRRNRIARRHGSEQNYATYKTKPQFRVKTFLTSSEELLRVAGVMLYMAEGAKTAHLVDFTNSDPSLVRVFLSSSSFARSVGLRSLD